MWRKSVLALLWAIGYGVADTPSMELVYPTGTPTVNFLDAVIVSWEVSDGTDADVDIYCGPIGEHSTPSYYFGVASTSTSTTGMYRPHADIELASFNSDCLKVALKVLRFHQSEASYRRWA
jgi:hypothetical protein